MAEEQKRYIDYLIERLNAIDMEKRVMKLVMQDFFEQQKKGCRTSCKIRRHAFSC